MLARQRFSELSHSLKLGFFADNAVLAISKVKKRVRLSEEDKKNLKAVDQFLKDVLDGFTWTDKPSFSRRSAASASAFSEAAK